jgi:hypothetical protein
MIYLYGNNKFTPTTEEELFSVSWENGETEENFLARAGFPYVNYTFGGLLRIWERTNFACYLLDIEFGDCGHMFYTPNLIELINLLKFLGMNFYEETKKKSEFKRVLPAYEINEDFPEFESIAPFYGNKVLVTSSEPIRSINEKAQEIRRVLAEKKKKEEAEKAAKQQNQLV